MPPPNDKDVIFVATWQEVAVSLFHLPLYPLVQQPVLLEGIPLATVPEIGAMKLAVTIDRGTRKDMIRRPWQKMKKFRVFGNWVMKVFSAEVAQA
jgi:hypothetical protein